MNAPANNREWVKTGPAMRALSNDQQREFVRQLFLQKPGHGVLTRAARAAGYGKHSTNANLAKIAHKLSRDERIIAAIEEESKKYIRVGYPEVMSAWMNLVRNPAHRDHGRAVMAGLDRADPLETRHSMEVVHKTIDPDQEALEELRAARALGATDETLRKLFGGNYLPKLLRLEAADNAKRADAAKVIDGEVLNDGP